jgi:hypothetical protein
LVVDAVPIPTWGGFAWCATIHRDPALAIHVPRGDEPDAARRRTILVILY